MSELDRREALKLFLAGAGALAVGAGPAGLGLGAKELPVSEALEEFSKIKTLGEAQPSDDLSHIRRAIAEVDPAMIQSGFLGQEPTTVLRLNHKHEQAPPGGWPLIFDLNHNIAKSTLLSTNTMRRLGGISRIGLLFHDTYCDFSAWCWPTPIVPNYMWFKTCEDKVIRSSLDPMVNEFENRYGRKHGYWLAGEAEPRYDDEQDQSYEEPATQHVCVDFHTREEIACKSELYYRTGQSVGKSSHRTGLYRLLSGRCDMLTPTELSDSSRDILSLSSKYAVMWSSFFNLSPESQLRPGTMHWLEENLGKHYSQWTMGGFKITGIMISNFDDRCHIIPKVAYPSVNEYVRERRRMTEFLAQRRALPPPQLPDTMLPDYTPFEATVVERAEQELLASKHLGQANGGKIDPAVVYQKLDRLVQLMAEQSSVPASLLEGQAKFAGPTLTN